MTRTLRLHRAGILLAWMLVPFLAAPADARDTSTTRGVVAAAHPIAAEYGARVLREGGNAVDAAVATALMLGVVDGHNSGIGGGCFMVIRAADGHLLCIDGRETAPAGARRDMFLRDGRADPELSTVGALAAGVPGSLAAYDLALRRHGTRSLAELLRGAADVAEAGFPIDRKYAARLAQESPTIRRFPATAAMLLKDDGSPHRAGDRLRLPDLARTYRAIAESGPDWFYRGPFARAVDHWMREHGGILRYEDFAEYQPKLRKPVVTSYRSYTIVGFPPPSSGGLHVGQILNILENFDLASLDEATRLHVIAEAMKLAFADRAHWLGDPDFVNVPHGLVSQEYADELARRISLDKASQVSGHGTPPGVHHNFFPSVEGHAPTSQRVEPTAQGLDDSHTAHLSAADEYGNWVALTATVNTGFGSKVVVPGTGVILNNQMDDFAAQPGVPNFFGLVGAEANAVQPRKRPLSSMSPTIVLTGVRDDDPGTGRPVLSVGGAGGPMIISATLQVILNVLDRDMTLEEALAAPRIHHQWRPDTLVVEAALDPTLRRTLEGMGHKLRVTDDGLGVAQAVSQSGARWDGAADPRAPGGAAVSD